MTNGNSAELARLLEDTRDYVSAFTDDRDDGYIAESLLAQIDLALSVCADGGKGEAVYQVLSDNVHAWIDVRKFSYDQYEGHKRIVYTAPQAECAPRAEDPDWMGKLPKCNEWPSGVAPRAEPVEESDVRPKERLCGGSHISCNGVDYCLGHPSCRDIAKERAKKEQK